jgi:plastocyanin
MSGLTLRMRLKRTRLLPIAVCAVVFLSTMACGGSSGSTPPTTPTPTPTPPTGGGSLPTAVTITIGTNGQVTPANVTIAVGGRVTFVNNHNQPHDMSSDPHPEHTDCPELNQVGFLTTGQSRASGNLNTRRTCGYHDHNQPTDSRYQGQVVIQ